MSFIIPLLSPIWELTGKIYDTDDIEFLDLDMFEARNSQTNMLVCTSWLPEHDLNGEYVVYVYCEDEDGSDMICRTKNQLEAKKSVERICNHEHTV